MSETRRVPEIPAFVSRFPGPLRAFVEITVRTVDEFLEDGGPRLAAALARLDIRNRYRGSVLGPFWLSLSTAIMVVALGLFSAALWQYHQMVVAIYDGATTSFYRRLFRPFRPPPEEADHHPVRIALMQRLPELAEDGVSAESYEGQISLWERMLSRQGFGVRRIREVRTPSDLIEFNLLVLPSVTALSATEQDVIKSYLARGGSAILSWAVGTRNAEGQWRPPDFLREIAGIDLGNPVPESETPGRTHISINPRSPLSFGMESGFTLDLMRFDQPLAAFVREPRTKVAAVWTEEARTAAATSFGVSWRTDRTVIAHGDYLDGRFVWLGFTISAAAPEPQQQRAFEMLMRNAVVWATRQPVAFKPNWPDEYSSALTLAWSLNDPSDYDERLPELAASHGISLTSYVSPAFMDAAPDKVRSLARHGPVGLLFRDFSFSEEGEVPTRSALEHWRRRVTSFNQTRYAGCRIVGSVVEPGWLDTLASAGFDYVASATSVYGLPHIVRTHRSIPILVRAHELWMVPDFEMSGAALSANAPRGGGRDLDSLFDHIHSRGGMLHLSVPTDLITGEAINELDRFLARVQRYRVWIAGSDRVMDFYRLWGHVRVFTDYPTPSRYVVQVNNSGTRRASDLTVFIRLPEPQSSPPAITPTTLGTPPVHAVSEDLQTWRFEIDGIDAGKTFIYHVHR